MNNAKKNVVAGLLVAAVVAGCATTGGPLTTQQKIRNCAGMVVGGALLGNLIGKDSEATAAGAALGGAACGVWLAFESAKDQQRLEDARNLALQTGQTQEDQWQGDDGQQRTVKVELGAESGLLASGVVCRPVMTTVGARGGSASHSEEWCRLPDGTYQPRSAVTA